MWRHAPLPLTKFNECNDRRRQPIDAHNGQERIRMRIEKEKGRKESCSSVIIPFSFAVCGGKQWVNVLIWYTILFNWTFRHRHTHTHQKIYNPIRLDFSIVSVYHSDMNIKWKAINYFSHNILLSKLSSPFQ